MGVERNPNKTPFGYFNRTHSRSKEREVGNLPDCFGRKTPTPLEIEKIIHLKDSQINPPKKSVVFFVDDSGIKPYQETDITPMKRSKETHGSDKYSCFKSRRRQSQSYRNNSNNKASTN